MKLGNLTLFGGKSSPGIVSIAWWHSPHSLTWRWTLCTYFKRSWRCGLFGGRHNCGGQWIFAGPFFAVQFSLQHPMWYRDMYRSDRDKRDRERSQKHVAQSELAARVSAVHGEHRTMQ